MVFALIRLHFGTFQSSLLISTPDAPQAITALIFMENLGGLVSPLLLRSWQSVAPGPSVFAFAVALLGVSLGLFLWGEVLCFNTSTPNAY
jgi:dipeptide/tripeptide permease